MNLSKYIEDISINKDIGIYVGDLTSIARFYEENCKSDFNANEYGHVIKSKFKFLMIINMNRMQFLVKSYLSELRELNPLSCNILLRSLMETSASMTHLFKNIISIMKDTRLNTENKLRELELIADKLSLGNKAEPKINDAVNVLTTMKSMDVFNIKYNFNKTKLSFFDLYSEISEIAHPNFDGYLLNMVKTGDSTIKILDEQREFLESDYRVVLFLEVNKTYIDAIKSINFLIENIDK